MATIEINALQLETLLENNTIVFVDFWAEWCAPCKQFALVYEEIAEANPQIVFAKVNIEKNSELAETLQIQSIPHLMVFKNKIMVYSESGSLPKSALQELVEQANGLDLK